jgi:hypothetical protein
MTRAMSDIRPYVLYRTREHHICCWYGMSPRVLLSACPAGGAA